MFGTTLLGRQFWNLIDDATKVIRLQWTWNLNLDSLIAESRLQHNIWPPYIIIFGSRMFMWNGRDLGVQSH